MIADGRLNPIPDGMNIVLKEASVVNEQEGVLILSGHRLL